MVREEVRDGKTIFICDCGLGYSDLLVAYACEEYYRTRGVNSEEIIKRAVYNHRNERAPKRAIVPP